TIQANSSPPSPSLLTSLYDLTPAEARLAAALSSGQSLEAAAAAGQITVKSARTYLERIFAKTGTNRQSGLVALLRSVPPLAAVQEQ
ncbi:MAG: helix-turn-helix transcriptional regulator, partial [Alphaproteobacteria bacterium]|nr:helix-turn-helix transcriptional regulator [Alphaproteobacteria bacterium]